MTPKDFQQTLKSAGYDPVWIDGLWGEKTANAARAWFDGGRDIPVAPTGTPPPTGPSQVVPDSWMPACEMKRVHVHWTAGAYAASENDREHYHILVDGDCGLVRGRYSIKANVSTSDEDGYAAHTKNANTGAIGISACCMAGAVESPFNAGKYPLQEDQWDMLARVAADLCRKYDIAVTLTTVLQHGEVEQNLGIDQSGKWDITKLPWQPGWTKSQVCGDFRARVQAYLSG